MKAFIQKEGVNFSEVFSTMVRHTSIRILLVLVAIFYPKLEQMDVKTTFLHGKPEEEICMSWLERSIANGNKDLVCLLDKSLRFDEFIQGK